MLNSGKFKKHANIIILVLALWAVICIAMFFYYAVIARDKYIKLGNKLAQREFLYYPERASILDKNGIALAWSEKYYDLYYNDLTGSPLQSNAILKEVKKLLPGVKEPPFEKTHALIFRNLRPQQILFLEKLTYLFPELQMTSRSERKVVSYPNIKFLIGRVKLNKRQFIGIDGLEKQHDVILSGTSGKFRIMLDRNKNQIKKSFKYLRKASRGKDIRLQSTLDEIRKRRQ